MENSQVLIEAGRIILKIFVLITQLEQLWHLSISFYLYSPTLSVYFLNYFKANSRCYAISTVDSWAYMYTLSGRDGQHDIYIVPLSHLKELIAILNTIRYLLHIHNSQIVSNIHLYSMCGQVNSMSKQGLIHLVVIPYSSFSIFSPLFPFFTFVIKFYFFSFILDGLLM